MLLMYVYTSGHEGAGGRLLSAPAGGVPRGTARDVAASPTSPPSDFLPSPLPFQDFTKSSVPGPGLPKHCATL